MVESYFVPQRRKRAAARLLCEQTAHQWKEFTAMGYQHRQCERCRRQEHRDQDGNWH